MSTPLKRRPPLGGGKHEAVGIGQTSKLTDNGAKNTNGDLSDSIDGENERFKESIEMETDDTKKQIVFLIMIFICGVGVLSFLYMNFPNMSSSDREKFKLPKNLDDAKDLGRVLSNYKNEFFAQVVLGFMATYIFLNAFAIPGSIFLSILSGFLFPFPLALFLVCLCTSLGSSLCYSLSAVVGKKLVKKYFPERIKEWKMHVDHHRENLLNYIIFLRITPFLPNWFINITSPVLGVSLWPFFLGTFLGVAPPSFGFISAGFELYELTATGDAFSFKSIALVVVAAIVSLLPVIFRKKVQEKIE